MAHITSPPSTARASLAGGVGVGKPSPSPSGGESERTRTTPLGNDLTALHRSQVWTTNRTPEHSPENHFKNEERDQLLLFLPSKTAKCAAEAHSADLGFLWIACTQRMRFHETFGRRPRHCQRRPGSAKADMSSPDVRNRPGFPWPFRPLA